MTHQLKAWNGSFEAVAEGRMKHSIRKTDRKFAVGDMLLLREFTPTVGPHGVALDKEGHTIGAYTGRTLLRKVSYISQAGSFGLPNDLCVLSFEEPARR